MMFLYRHCLHQLQQLFHPNQMQKYWIGDSRTCHPRNSSLAMDLIGNVVRLHSVALKLTASTTTIVQKEEREVRILAEHMYNNHWRSSLENVDIAPGFINTKYECLRPTPYEPKYNRKLVSLLLLLERKRHIDNELKRSLSYRHAISAIKVRARPRKS